MGDLKVRWALHDGIDEPTSRHRGIYVYQALREMGWDADSWDLNEQADIIVCQYSFRDLRAALGHAAVVVADINDMVFIEGHPTSAGFDENIRKVNAVVAGTERLAEFLVQRHPFVRQIHDVLHPMYRVLPRVPHDGTNVLFVGMNQNARYFRECDAVLEQLAHEFEFTVHFVIPASDGGGGDNRKMVASKLYPTEFHEWTMGTMLNQIARADIAWVPLPSNAWTVAKSPNKPLMFMSAGVATIASDVPVYQKYMRHGVDSYLCRHPEDWLKYGRMLLGDARRRVKIAEAGRDAGLLFTPDKIACQWANLFEEIAPR